MNIYAEITKADEEKRMVYGYASTDSLDSQGERVEKSAIAAALDDYMKWANIREMHQASAVGVAKEADLDDKGLYIAAKVVDDAAWEKVREGVYKGFSVGGKKISKVDDTVTALKLTEISLVDRPANPDCKFDVFKAEGSAEGETVEEELKKFLGEEVWDAGRAIGCLDTLYSLFSKEQGETDHPDAASQTADLAAAILRLKSYIASEIGEKPDMGTGVASDAVAYAEGAGDDVVKAEGDSKPEGDNAADAELAKAGARNSKGDMGKIQGIHDHAIALGAECAKCDTGKADGGDDLKKAHDDTLAKLTETEAELAKAQDVISKHEARIKELEAMPAPAKGSVTAVAKGDDAAQATTKEADPILKNDGSVNEVATEIKKAFLSGGQRLFTKE